MATKEQLAAFVDACKELKNSKIILADAKVSAIVRSIVSNPALVDVVGETLTGYNFLNALDAVSRSKNGSILPSEPRKVIAFVFSLLSEIDARRLDLQEFVDQYFAGETLAESFENFNSQLIDPFCHYLCDWVCASRDNPADNVCSCGQCERQDSEEECRCDCDSEETDCLVTEVDKVEQFFADVRTILTQIHDTIALDSKIKPDRLTDLNITISAMLEAIDLENLKIFNALLISLNTLLHSVKSVRFYYKELQNRVADFYDIA